MIDFVEFKGVLYPKIQSIGNASQFAIPFAKHYCKGVGVDIGFCKEEWKFPGAIGADIADSSNDYHAFNLPKELDYIYSSHCLEHLDDWVLALEYWISRLSSGGIIFLYLPHEDQEYWLPWNNRKHKHILNAVHIKKCMEHFKMKKVIFSEKDLNCSFIIVGEKE